MQNCVLIVLTVSSYYAPYMSVTIQSIIEHCSSQINYEIVVLNRELTSELQSIVEGMAASYQNIKIRFKKIKEEYYKKNFSMRTGYSAESFFRVLLPYIFESENKILYLDSDTVVNRDIAELYQENISDYFAGVVRDYDGIGCAYNLETGRKHYMKTVLKISNCDDYFQSGVMLFNLSAIRAEYTVNDLLNAACDPAIQWGDQDVLNYLFRGRVKYLDNRWNVVVNDKIVQQMWSLQKYAPLNLRNSYLIAREDPYIVHYAATQPWNIPLVDMAPYFWNYAYRSPLYPVIVEHTEAQINPSARITDAYFLPQMVLEQFRKGKVGARYIIQYIKAWSIFKLYKLKSAEKIAKSKGDRSFKRKLR